MALKERWSRPSEWRKSHHNVEKQQECLDFLSGVRTAERAEGFFYGASMLIFD